MLQRALRASLAGMQRRQSKRKIKKRMNTFVQPGPDAHCRRQTFYITSASVPGLPNRTSKHRAVTTIRATPAPTSAQFLALTGDFQDPSDVSYINRHRSCAKQPDQACQPTTTTVTFAKLLKVDASLPRRNRAHGPQQMRKAKGLVFQWQAYTVTQA